jgi:ankyrin repeat protein
MGNKAFKPADGDAIVELFRTRQYPQAKTLISTLNDVDINYKTAPEGFFPLYYAASDGNLVECADLVIEMKSDVNNTCNDGRSSLDIAIENDHLEVVKLSCCWQTEHHLQAMHSMPLY